MIDQPNTFNLNANSEPFLWGDPEDEDEYDEVEECTIK